MSERISRDTNWWKEALTKFKIVLAGFLDLSDLLEAINMGAISWSTRITFCEKIWELCPQPWSARIRFIEGFKRWIGLGS